MTFKGSKKKVNQSPKIKDFFYMKILLVLGLLCLFRKVHYVNFKGVVALSFYYQLVFCLQWLIASFSVCEKQNWWLVWIHKCYNTERTSTVCENQ